MENIRFTNLHIQNTPKFGPSFVAGMETEASLTNPAAQLGVNEIVSDSWNGTLTPMQESPSMSSILNDGTRSYSFVV